MKIKITIKKICRIVIMIRARKLQLSRALSLKTLNKGSLSSMRQQNWQNKTSSPREKMRMKWMMTFLRSSTLRMWTREHWITTRQPTCSKGRMNCSWANWNNAKSKPRNQSHRASRDRRNNNNEWLSKRVLFYSQVCLDLRKYSSCLIKKLTIVFLATKMTTSNNCNQQPLQPKKLKLFSHKMHQPIRKYWNSQNSTACQN